MGKRKRTLILILLFCLPLIVGFKLTAVELKGTDRDNPLVNLGAIIQLGGEYASGKASETVKEQVKEGKETETETKTGGKDQPVKDPSETRIAVKISNKNIYINNKLVGKAIFERTFNSLYKAGTGVDLIDDYAEYGTYIEIRDYLTENKVSFSQSMLE